MRSKAFTHVMYFTHFAPMYNQRMWYPTLYPIDM